MARRYRLQRFKVASGYVQRSATTRLVQESGCQATAASTAPALFSQRLRAGQDMPVNGLQRPQAAGVAGKAAFTPARSASGSG